VKKEATMIDIPVGYKNTEIGIIPEDWEIRTYDEAFDFLTTANYSRAELTEIDEVRYIHYGDIHTKWNFFLDIGKSNLPTIRQEQVKNYHLLKDGDVIMADASEDYSGIGKSVEVKNLGSVKAISGLHTFLFRNKNDVFVNGFKGYIHFNKVVKTQFDRLATGLKVYGVSKGNLKIVKIPVPSLPEQTAIAEILSDTDNLIQALEKQIAKKRNIKQGAMQKLLQPKEGWEVKKLGDLNFDISDGNYSSKYPSSSEFKEFGIPFIRANNIKKMTVIDDDMRYISSDLHFELAKGHLKTGDILITTRGEIGKISIVPKRFVDSNINAQIVRINTNKKINNLYFAYFLQKSETQTIFLNLQSGSALKQLPVGKLKQLELVYPSFEEQTRIATILSDMDTELNALESTLEKYKMLKLGMMQNLLTGKIRLIKS